MPGRTSSSGKTIGYGSSPRPCAFSSASRSGAVKTFPKTKSCAWSGAHRKGAAMCSPTRSGSCEKRSVTTREHRNSSRRFLGGGIVSWHMSTRSRMESRRNRDLLWIRVEPARRPFDSTKARRLSGWTARRAAAGLENQIWPVAGRSRETDPCPRDLHID